MSENIEVMETTINEETNDIVDTFDCSESGGSGKAIGLTVGLLTGVVALGAAAYKKYKSKKKDEKPRKKVRKKLRWVEVEDDVEDENIVDSTAEEVDGEEVVSEE